MPRVVVLDNLKEGVLKPDIFDPELNPLYRDVLAHYGVVALPARVRHPDRKGKVERAVGHAQDTPLKGKRFETLEDAQAYLDKWSETWADTRIHGTTKRQVAAMFEEEKPHLKPLPITPFRYFQFGSRTVHLDGCVEIEAAYYGAPPGWIGKRIAVQWNDSWVRLIDPITGELPGESRKQPRGYRYVHEDDKPAKTPPTTLTLLAKASRAGKSIGALCDETHRREEEGGVRRILGVLSLVKKYGAPAVDEACALALELGVPHYRFVRQLIERNPPVPITLRQVDPLIRQLTLYRDLINQKNRKQRHMNQIEMDRALRKLRLSGMADTLETRVIEAQVSNFSGMDFLSTLVSDELERRQDRLIERRIKQARFRDPNKTLDGFDFDFNKKMNRKLVFELGTGRFVSRHEDALLLGPPGTGKSHVVQAIGHAVILQGWAVAYREAHVLLEELADATLEGTRKEYMAAMSKVPLLIIDDLGMRKLPHTAVEDLLELIMRRYERSSTILTSNRPVEDWGKLLGGCLKYWRSSMRREDRRIADRQYLRQPPSSRW